MRFDRMRSIDSSDLLWLIIGIAIGMMIGMLFGK